MALNASFCALKAVSCAAYWALESSTGARSDKRPKSACYQKCTALSGKRVSVATLLPETLSVQGLLFLTMCFINSTPSRWTERFKSEVSAGN